MGFTREFMLVMFCVITTAVVVNSCQEESSFPKPYGYMRIDLPEPSYTTYEDSCPYSFEIPEYAIVEEKPDTTSDCHKNIIYKGFNATLHLSYFSVQDDLSRYLEYSRSLAYQHQVKADAIMDSIFIFPEERLYGTAHFIEGNAASPFQFYITDSTNHFIRGSLYFNTTPNFDSLKPSIDHLIKDVKRQIETTRWK